MFNFKILHAELVTKAMRSTTYKEYSTKNTHIIRSDHWLDEVRRLRWGGVGAIGLRGGVAPFDFIDPVGVDVRLPPPPAAPAEGRNLMEE